MRFLIFFLLAGCGPQGDPTPLPTQAAAVQLTWSMYEAYYGPIGDPPPIYWRRDRCGEPNGIYGPSPVCSFDGNGIGEGGREIDTPTGEWIEVGAPSFAPYKIGVTDLMHELLHAAQAHIGIFDQTHTRHEWLDNIPAQAFQIKHLAEQAVIAADL